MAYVFSSWAYIFFQDSANERNTWRSGGAGGGDGTPPEEAASHVRVVESPAQLLRELMKQIALLDD
jgi:hypothetical protein